MMKYTPVVRRLKRPMTHATTADTEIATSQISGLIEEITQATHKQADEFKSVTVTVTEATETAGQTAKNSEQLTQSIHQLLTTAKALQASTGT